MMICGTLRKREKKRTDLVVFVRPLELPNLFLLRNGNNNDEIPTIPNRLKGLLLCNCCRGFGFGFFLVIIVEETLRLVVRGCHLQNISGKQTGREATIVGDIAQTRLPFHFSRKHRFATPTAKQPTGSDVWDTSVLQRARLLLSSSVPAPVCSVLLGRLIMNRKTRRVGGWVGEGEQDDGGEGINKEEEIERESPSGFGSDFWS
jgi:hypothetical protein